MSELFYTVASTHCPSLDIDDFCACIEEYQRSMPDSKTEMRIDIRNNHTWEEVLNAAKEAERIYNVDPAQKSAKRWLRQGFRTLGDYSSGLNPWVGLVPNDKYMSVVNGGLKVILGVCERNGIRRLG